jgi:hypothetical protein
MSLAYGVDVQGDGACIMVSAERRGRRWRYARVAATSGSAVPPGVPVAACMNMRESVAQWIEAPFGARSKALRVFPTLLDVELPFPLEACAWDFLDAHKASGSSYRALAVASRLETMRRKLDALAALGVDPQSLDQEALVLWSQSLRELPAADGDNDVRVVLYMADDRWCLVAGRGRRIVHACAPRQEQGAGMLRLLDIFLRPADRIRWCIAGPAAERSSAGLEGELLRARPGIWSLHNAPAEFLARGLATRQLAAEPYACNLRTDALQHAGARRRVERQSRGAALAVLAAAGLLVAANLAAHVGVTRRQDVMRNSYRALAARLAGQDIGPAKGEHALRIVEDALHRREVALKPFLAAFELSLTATALEMVRAAGKAGIQIEALALDRQSLSAKGTAPEWRSPEALAAMAMAHGCKVSLQRLPARMDGRIPFELRPEAAHE